MEQHWGRLRLLHNKIKLNIEKHKWLYTCNPTNDSLFNKIYPTSALDWHGIDQNEYIFLKLN